MMCEGDDGGQRKKVDVRCIKVDYEIVGQQVGVQCEWLDALICKSSRQLMTNVQLLEERP